MIRRVLVITLMLVVAAVLQTSVFPSLTFLGFSPDLLLLAAVALAMRDGPMSGARVGAVAGLLTDLLVVQAPVGLGMLVFTIVGYGVGFARPYLASDSITAPLLLTFVSGGLATGAYGLASYVFVDQSSDTAMLVRASIAVALYNTLLAPVAITLMRRLSNRFPLQAAVE